METNNFDHKTETLILAELEEENNNNNNRSEDNNPSFDPFTLVFDNLDEETILIDSKIGDSMLCDSTCRLVTSGFSTSCSSYTDDIVTFVNTGCEHTIRADSGVEFAADTHYEGGDILRTNESISDGGDYPFIYQSARYGNFSYKLRDLPAGDYFVDLHFAEIINTYGPKGMRLFNVFIQDEKVLSDFDIFSVVGANKPLLLVDFRTPVKEDGLILIRFEGLLGAAVVSGICIRRAPKLSEEGSMYKWEDMGIVQGFPNYFDDFLADHQLLHEHLRCHNCTADVEVPVAQEKSMRLKMTAKYEKKIEELSQQCQRKTDECYQAWMSLTAANEQLEKVKMELDNKLFKTYSLDQTVEKQTEELKAISSKYEHDKRYWILSISQLEEKVKKLKKEHSQLSREAHECADSIPELTQMVSAVQNLVVQCDEFKEKYVEEQRKRKKLFNEVQEAKGNIRVFCRCRPLNKKEQSMGYSTVVDFEGAKDGELTILNGGLNKKIFRFDGVYMPKDHQGEVFADASPMATSVLDGYNVCIFAYGQTGTGKTFTMEGTEQNRGVNYRTLEQLFQSAQDRSDTFTYDISVSVLEVYNEQIRDLLDTSNAPKKLEIKQASEGSHHVPGIVEAKVGDTKQVWEVLRIGSNARAVGSNNVNEHSSRSHCMLCVMVKAKNLINGESTKSKLWLVDLAGSERLAKTDVQGERLKEAQSINKSLSALGDVISALANKSSHIPYRNSKLTHLLQDSLGGNSKTLMFVHISPSEHDVGETVSSLNFASRVRGVELAPAKRQLDTSELQKAKSLLDKAKMESKSKDELIKKLEESLKNVENKTRSKDETCKNQQGKIREFEEQLQSLQERLKGREETCCSLQNQVKELQLKLRDQQQNDTAALQQTRELEKKLKEQIQESELQSLTLQHKINELEVKLAQEHSAEFSLMRQKVSELEEKLKEKEQEMEKLKEENELEQGKRRMLQAAQQDNNGGEGAGAHSPIVAKPPCIKDVTIAEVDPFILRSSNSSNRMSHGSTKSKRNEFTYETRRKREFRSGESNENQMPPPPPLPDKRIRKSDPPKPFSCITSKTVRPVAATNPQRPVARTRVGAKEKDTKKRTWC